MTGTITAALEHQQFVLWNGFLVPVDFPYLNALLLGRPRHTMDDFSFRHPQMDQGKRAKVFAPFDALDGYGESISEKNTVYTDKIILDESEKEELNRRLAILHHLTYNSRLAKANRVIVTVVVWKVDMEVGKTITVNQKMIAFDDILAITAKKDNIFACTWDES